MQVFLDRLEAVSKIVLIIGTLVGGWWGLSEYRQKQQDARVAQAIDYVRRWSTDPYMSAQTRIGSAWYAVHNVVQVLNTTPVSSKDEFAARKRQLVLMVVNNQVVPLSTTTSQKGVVPDVDLVVGFFAELQVCIGANLCDAGTATSFFQADAKRFYCVHEPFISWKDTNYSKGYGAQMRAFALGAGGSCS